MSRRTRFSRACEGCGAAMHGVGHNRRYCTERCRRDSMRPGRAIPAETRRAVARRAGVESGRGPAACEYCGAPGEVQWSGSHVWFRGLDLDHVIPHSRGGDGRPENVVLACTTCNRGKRDRTVAEWQGEAA